MRPIGLLVMVACTPQEKDISNWTDSGQEVAHDEQEATGDGQGSPTEHGTPPEDGPIDPTEEVDGDSLDAGTNPCRTPVLGRVMEVTDGDTIKVQTGRGVERVRLIGINAPEVDHSGPDDDCFGEESSDFLEEIVGNRMVWLTFDAECDDRYDRTLAYVHTHAEFVQRALLLAGMVSEYRVSPNTSFASLFAADENTARMEGAGMWGVCR